MTTEDLRLGFDYMPIDCVRYVVDKPSLDLVRYDPARTLGVLDWDEPVRCSHRLQRVVGRLHGRSWFSPSGFVVWSFAVCEHCGDGRILIVGPIVSDEEVAR